MSSQNASPVPERHRNHSKNGLEFLVVGLGASAGGLPALVSFFENMPVSQDMAFVVILHLSPVHDSSADQILQRATRMPVVQVVQRTALERNHVYVIAPNKSLDMHDGFLDVGVMARPIGQHIAIDVFFRALALAHGPRAVAIVLSGTGADGAVGLAQIKEQGGLTIAQAPDDAEHEGMPTAAIRTGMVDFVLPVREIPQKLMDTWANARAIELPALGDGDAPFHVVADAAGNSQAEEAMQQVIALLRLQTGHDFRHYKRATVLRRIERRLQVRGVPTLPAYRALLENDGAEPQALLQDMLIGVTNFFRDREAFDVLEREVIVELGRTKSDADSIRVWVAACASGEEAYSMAMLLEDIFAMQPTPPTIQVFASDIDERAIAMARAGRYPASIAADITPTRLRQYFSRREDEYQVRKNIRDKVLFAAHNLLRDPPFSRLDMISCRNLLIYLNREVQTYVLEMFHFALNPGGILFLGSSESAESAGAFFEPIDKKYRIYRARQLPRAQRYAAPMTRTLMPRASDGAAGRTTGKQRFSFAEVHQRILAQHAPPSMVVSRDDNVLHMSDRAGRFLRHVGGEPSRNLLSLVHPALRQELRSALLRAKTTNLPVQAAPVAMARDGLLRSVAMTVRPFHDADAGADLLLVVFAETEDVPVSAPSDPDAERENLLTQMEEELQRHRDQLQQTIEQAEVSTEELRASNEELQAINEELRSATEELETSKEELQSINEELVTVNYELKAKVEETGKANDDLNNLIASTDIATIFVDSTLRIKRFTPRATDIFSMIATDIGRSLLDITHKLDYAELADDAASTFKTLRPVEREVRQRDGRHYIVRFLPYRTVEDRIDGAVLTFFDISGRRNAEAQMRRSDERLRLVAESTRDYAIMTLDVAGFVTSWNAGAERIFGYAEDEILGQHGDVLFTEQDRRDGVPEDERRRARDSGRAEDERWHLRKDGSTFYCSGVMTRLGDDAFHGYAKIGRDQTDRMSVHRARTTEPATPHAQGAPDVQSIPGRHEFLAVMSHELRRPLNLIHINIELLSRLPEIQRSAVTVKAAGAIRNAVLGQARIIDDLLDMSRLGDGRLSLAIADVDLAAIVNEQVGMVRADPAAAALRVLTSGCDLPLLVRADLVRTEQVVMNLLANAVKFTAAGSIRVELGRDGDAARLDVIDTGQGINASFLPHVFDLYGQGGMGGAIGARPKGGLGIGLALVRQIIALQGGRVAAQSAGVGCGARFTVWLPLRPGSAAAGPAPPDSLENSLRGIRLLLIDDSEDVAASFKALLEMAGATVHCSGSGADALALLETVAVDCLIVDLSMPEMDGLAFMRAVRRQSRLAGLAAIAVSGLDRAEDVARCMAAGFDAHMGKPLPVEALVSTIRALLAPQ